jgi:hypothetical protein
VFALLEANSQRAYAHSRVTARSDVGYMISHARERFNKAELTKLSG